MRVNVPRLFKQVEKLAVSNSPAILTAVGVAGTITTAYLTGKASFKAAEIIHKESFKKKLNDRPVQLTSKDKFALIWKLYIPATGSALLTVGAILGANHINTKRAAALAAAYSVSEKAYSEYKDKIAEKLGLEKEQEVRNDIAQDRVNRNGPPEVYIAGQGDVLCHDAFSGRYFMSTKEDLKAAQNAVNYQIIKHDAATLTNFYRQIGLEPTQISDELGWNHDNPLELLFAGAMTAKGEPCLSFEFENAPQPHFDRFR